MRKCSIDGCEKKVFSKKMCRNHYANDYYAKHYKRERKQRPARMCSVEGCDNKHYGKDFCAKHYQRWSKFGDASITMKQGRKETDTPAYSTIHNRLSQQRGPASNYSCADCGGRADDWSYTHEDPNEFVDASTGFPYSADLSCYVPRCKKDHLIFDGVLMSA